MGAIAYNPATNDELVGQASQTLEYYVGERVHCAALAGGVPACIAGALAISSLCAQPKSSRLLLVCQASAPSQLACCAGFCRRPARLLSRHLPDPSTAPNGGAARNKPPAAVDTRGTVNLTRSFDAVEDQTLSVNFANGLLAGSARPAQFIVRITESATDGTFTSGTNANGDNDGSFAFDPNPNFCGAVTFKFDAYTVIAGTTLYTNAGTATINVGGSCCLPPLVGRGLLLYTSAVHGAFTSAPGLPTPVTQPTPFQPALDPNQSQPKRQPVSRTPPSLPTSTMGG